MKTRRAFTVMEAVVVLSVFLVTVIALTPFVNMARQRSKRLQCVDNLRRISLGLHAYAAGHDGAFPAKLEELYPDYVADRDTFDCPAGRLKGTPAEPEYMYATGLSEASGLKDVVVEDLPENHKKQGENALRLDGSIEWVRAK